MLVAPKMLLQLAVQDIGQLTDIEPRRVRQALSCPVLADRAHHQGPDQACDRLIETTLSGVPRSNAALTCGASDRLRLQRRLHLSYPGTTRRIRRSRWVARDGREYARYSARVARPSASSRSSSRVRARGSGSASRGRGSGRSQGRWCDERGVALRVQREGLPVG